MAIPKREDRVSRGTEGGPSSLRGGVGGSSVDIVKLAFEVLMEP